MGSFGGVLLWWAVFSGAISMGQFWFACFGGHFRSIDGQFRWGSLGGAVGMGQVQLECRWGIVGGAVLVGQYSWSSLVEVVLLGESGMLSQCG